MLCEQSEVKGYSMYCEQNQVKGCGMHCEYIEVKGYSVYCVQNEVKGCVSDTCTLLNTLFKKKKKRGALA